MPDFSPADAEHVTLCEVLDRILNKGAVIVGEVRISVANIDLIYLGLQVVLTSIETARANNGSNGKWMPCNLSRHDDPHLPVDAAPGSGETETTDGKTRP